MNEPLAADDAHALRVFGNALRDMLDLDPIYDDGRHVKNPQAATDAERFYVAPQAWPRSPASRRV